MVLSEAVYQLGHIGLDPSEEVSRPIAWLLSRYTAVAPDNNLAMACLLALEKLGARDHGLRDPLVYSAIARVATGRYIETVKDKAVEVLAQLAKYR